MPNRYSLHSFIRPKSYSEFNVGDRVKYTPAAVDKYHAMFDDDVTRDLHTWRGVVTHRAPIFNLCIVKWDHQTGIKYSDSEIDVSELTHE